MSDRTKVAEAPELDQGWLRSLLDELCAFDRETATPGERRAAEWLAERLREQGAEAELEHERLHNTYWWPLGIAGAAGAAAGLAGLRGHRLFAAALGTAAAAAAADDLPPRSRRLRRLLPKRETTQLTAALGPADADRTVVVVAHHDTAHPGLVFHPQIPLTVDRLFPQAFQKSDTSPPLMWLVVIAPLVAGLAGALGARRAAALASFLSAGWAAEMAEIGSGGAVPGANDNGTGVVVLVALARALAERPAERTRVLLVSTSEEGTCEGIQAWGRRHFPQLPRESTFFLSVDTVGSPHLCVLRGEGMLGITEYPERSLRLLDGVASELGIELFPNLRLRNATDGVEPLAAGYECASLASVTHLKQPANYHWRTDVPENVELGTLADAVRLVEAVVRRLDERWL